MSDWSYIDEGVRGLVKELNEVHGIKTTDSGDGSKWTPETSGTTSPYRHVYGIVPKGESVESFYKRLTDLYPDADVEISYARGGGIFYLLPDGIPDDIIDTLDKPGEMLKRYRETLEKIHKLVSDSLKE